MFLYHAYFDSKICFCRDTFTDLLSSNDLSAADSIIIDVADLDFLHILAKICFHCNFSGKFSLFCHYQKSLLKNEIIFKTTVNKILLPIAVVEQFKSW